MGSRTKIVVLHMKEIIYTAVFAALAVILILLLVFMFHPGQKNNTQTTQKYTPGTYTSTVTLNNNDLEVEVSVDESHINSIRFSNLDESVAAMYPLLATSMDNISAQLAAGVSVEDISYSSSSRYTSQVLLGAVSQAINKAR